MAGIIRRMARNIGDTRCKLCGGETEVVGEPRIAGADDVKGHVEPGTFRCADAECVRCGAQYLAWFGYPGKPQGDSPVDLSFRSTFNDEPGPDDYGARSNDADETPRPVPTMPRPRAREITPVLSPVGNGRIATRPFVGAICECDDEGDLIHLDGRDTIGWKDAKQCSFHPPADMGYMKLTGVGLGDTVLHAPSGVVGVVKKVHGPGEYLVKPAGSEGSGRPVSEAVVELEDGNAFLFRPGSFMVLDGGAVAFRETLVRSLSDWTTSTTIVAKRHGVARETGLALVRAVLSAQLRALSAGVTEVGRVAARNAAGAEADLG